MGIAGRSRAAEVFTTEAMMKQIVGVYDHLLASLPVDAVSQS
jgi:hypothetical protein